MWRLIIKIKIVVMVMVKEVHVEVRNVSKYFSNSESHDLFVMPGAFMGIEFKFINKGSTLSPEPCLL